MDGARSTVDVEADAGQGPSTANAASSLKEVTAAAVREKITELDLDPWAPWITPAVVAYVVAKGGPTEVNLATVVIDEMAKRDEYMDLFAAIPDPTSKAAAQLRALVSRMVSPVGVHIVGENTVCDLIPREAPGEPPAPPRPILPWFPPGGPWT